MTPNAKAARDGRSSDKLTGAGMFAGPDSRLRSAHNGTHGHVGRRMHSSRKAGSAGVAGGACLPDLPVVFDG
jgi:hypothetical protein